MPGYQRKRETKSATTPAAFKRHTQRIVNTVLAQVRYRPCGFMQSVGVRRAVPQQRNGRSKKSDGAHACSERDSL